MRLKVTLGFKSSLLSCGERLRGEEAEGLEDRKRQWVVREREEG